MEVRTRKELSVGSVLIESLSLGIKNIFSLIGACLLMGLLAWIPYINISAFIGLINFPVEMAQSDRAVSPTCILDKKYREGLGDIFLFGGYMMFVILMTSLFVFASSYFSFIYILPGVALFSDDFVHLVITGKGVLAVWAGLMSFVSMISFFVTMCAFATKLFLTPFLIFINKMSVWDALKESKKRMKGNEWTVGLVFLLIAVSVSILLIASILCAISAFENKYVSVLLAIGGVALYALVMLSGLEAVVYRSLVVENVLEEAEEELPEEPKVVVESPQPKEESSEDYYRKYMPHGYDRGGSYDKKE